LILGHKIFSVVGLFGGRTILCVSEAKVHENRELCQPYMLKPASSSKTKKLLVRFVGHLQTLNESTELGPGVVGGTSWTTL